MSLSDKSPDESIVRDNRHQHRFELKTDGKLSIVAYQKVDDETLALTHTEVDPSLEGHGVGSKLVQSVLEYVERNNLKIIPLCPFVTTYLKRHPDWNRVVSKDYNVSDF
ncbi:N-acetyltransferase [Spirosoma taeanense]|uniref:N-acetyltransferase n=1 Tax=Spirosoma taeanense TaxID=2735870 RepID=A0A6M5Y6Q2_9BACT|nr:GNAT family N-acetyltransferase [Spirosoma taeanense]QJW90088.1 N-acetyltransferase [Spirosoma taeanense]